MIEKINYVVMCLFFICYSYQFFYILVSWLRKPKPHKPEVYHRIAVLIAARNEQTVIGNLIDSIKAQAQKEAAALDGKHSSVFA